MTLPMRPTRTWPTRSHRLSKSICPGDEDCEYEPKVTGVGARVMSSGCNVVWRTYSEAIFEAFRNANPDLQYKNHHPCVLEAQRTGHRCPGRNCGGGRGTPLDHDELVRFPDNEKIIISHPYPNGGHYGDTSDAWGQHVPGLELRIGGIERSWYFPQASSLVIVGQQRVLERVNLDYPLLLGNEPSGCVRWPRS